MNQEELIRFAIDNKEKIIECSKNIIEGYIAATENGNITPVSPGWQTFSNSLSFPLSCTTKEFDEIIKHEKIFLH